MLRKKSKILKVFIAASSSLFAIDLCHNFSYGAMGVLFGPLNNLSNTLGSDRSPIPQRIESARDKLSELRVEFVRSGKSMGEVIYSGRGALVLRERLECSQGKEIIDVMAIMDLSDGLRRVRRVSGRKKVQNDQQLL